MVVVLEVGGGDQNGVLMIYELAGAGGGRLSSSSPLTLRVFNILIMPHDTFCTWKRGPADWPYLQGRLPLHYHCPRRVVPRLKQAKTNYLD